MLARGEKYYRSDREVCRMGVYFAIPEPSCLSF